MKLNLKDEPKEWRKSAWLAALGLALISSLLRWRHVLTGLTWVALLVMLALVAVAAGLAPRWFRGYHLISMRTGFMISRLMGHVLLVVFFLLIITPVGWLLRLAGKDALQLKRPPSIATYWSAARRPGPLDRLF